MKVDTMKPATVRTPALLVGFVVLVLAVGLLLGRSTVDQGVKGHDFTGKVTLVNDGQTAVAILDSDGHRVTGILANDTGAPLRPGEQVSGEWFTEPNVVYVK